MALEMTWSILMLGAPFPISLIKSKLGVIPTRVANTLIVDTYCIYIELMLLVSEVRNQINSFTQTIGEP
jgi:hypothetical protein